MNVIATPQSKGSIRSRGCPPPDESARGPRLDVAGDQIPIEVEFSLLTLVLGVEVSWLMLNVEHPNCDSEKRRDNRQLKVYRVATQINMPSSSAAAAALRNRGLGFFGAPME
jgi:hypothetical protein